SDFKVMFSDSTIMEWQMEGPWGQPIKSFKRISKQQYQLSLESKREKTDLEIRILDTVNQIAVFKELSFRSKPRYFFMVVAEFAKNFPIIVNYCPMGRRNEFEFETPDFTKYLKK
ncbi:MAG TPA: hypothetical protein VEC36_03470, partial [Patescibacteria group bacterium]|nr:hypothetical protein [Patescibacteria group bacterium]